MCLPDLSNIEWVEIQEILTSWLSCDSTEILSNQSPKQKKRKWSELIKDVRLDDSYEEVKLFIDDEGFWIPLEYRKENGYNLFTNGHHRLAAAIELGYKYVPMIIIDDNHCYFNIRSFIDADIELTRLIHPENPDAEFIMK